jgi:hypothetical protein
LAKKRGIAGIGDDEIIRFLRGSAIESAASTFTQTSQDTQLSVERGVVMLIHWLELEFETIGLLSEVAANASEAITAQITRETETAIQNIDSTDVVLKYELNLVRAAAIGTDAGPLWFQHTNPVRFDYPVPIVYASQNIFFGIQGTDGATPHSVSYRIGYTLREVSDEFFFRVATALL